MCETCDRKYSLEKTRNLANKIIQVLQENIIIYHNLLGYSIISEKCFQPEYGTKIETIIYE